MNWSVTYLWSREANSSLLRQFVFVRDLQVGRLRFPARSTAGFSRRRAVQQIVQARLNSCCERSGEKTQGTNWARSLKPLRFI